MKPEDEAVVVPLVPTEGELTTEKMLRLLLNEDAVLISQNKSQVGNQKTAMSAHAAGAFGKAISEVTRQFTQKVALGEGYFKVITPAGSTLNDLTRAVGGGFRGTVRAAGSTKIAGQTRLIPAAATAGGAIAAGPLIATIALVAGSEMLTQHQTDKKLQAIDNAVHGIQKRMDAEERSVLTTAEQQAHKVAGYLLDRAQLPEISSAAYAFGELDVLTNSYIERLDQWRDIVKQHQASSHIYGPELMAELVDKRENASVEFENMVAQTYEAIALRSRVVVLEKTAAEFSNPNRSLHHTQKVLQAELSNLAERQNQLVELLDDLNVMPIDSSKVPVTFAGKGTLQARTSFAKLARALHSAPEGLPLLTQSGQEVIDLSSNEEGLSIIEPSESGSE